MGNYWITCEFSWINYSARRRWSIIIMWLNPIWCRYVKDSCNERTMSFHYEELNHNEKIDEKRSMKWVLLSSQEPFQWFPWSGTQKREAFDCMLQSNSNITKGILRGEIEVHDNVSISQGHRRAKWKRSGKLFFSLALKFEFLTTSASKWNSIKVEISINIYSLRRDETN